MVKMQNPSTQVEVRVVIFSLKESRLSVLLVPGQTGNPANTWQLPGKTIHPALSLEKLASQSIQEIVGDHEFYLEQLYTYGDLDRHPNLRLISVVYFALISSNVEIVDKSRNALQPDWFAVDALPHLIMDHHNIVKYALRRLRYKLEYSAVGFELLPEFFSLSELQHTYELILGVKLDKRNFRRRILKAGIIERTPHRRAGEGRPAQLYRYRDDAIAEVKARRLFP